jgi:4-aminobutyrate aminotransferase-like enzyme
VVRTKPLTKSLRGVQTPGTKVVGVEPNEYMDAYAKEKAAALGLQLEVVRCVKRTTHTATCEMYRYTREAVCFLVQMAQY